MLFVKARLIIIMIFLCRDVSIKDKLFINLNIKFKLCFYFVFYIV